MQTPVGTQPLPTCGQVEFAANQLGGAAHDCKNEEFEYVTVVGTSHLGKRTPNGNKTHFMNHGIRQVKLTQEMIETLPESMKKKYHNVLIVFKDEYSSELLEAFKEIVTVKYKAEYREVTNASDLVKFFNGWKERGRQYASIIFYCHGSSSRFDIGHDIKPDEREDALAYWKESVPADKPGGAVINDTAGFSPEAFTRQAKIVSYACRTGLGNNIDSDERTLKTPTDFDKSIAQLLANKTQVKVHAFACRSLYQNTYGTSKERKRAQEALSILTEWEAYDSDKATYDAAWDSYNRARTEYDKDLLAWGKSNPFPPLKEVPVMLNGKARPTPPSMEKPEKPYEKRPSPKDQELAEQMKSRNEHEQRVGFPLCELGATNPVAAGDTPRNLPPECYQLRVYKPNGRA
jgi:hypothetical protein